MAEEKLDRIAIVNPDKCRPKKCGLECKKVCPVNAMGKICIDVKKDSIVANISETLCIGCNLCVKQSQTSKHNDKGRGCPFNAITIVNLPKGLAKDLVHRYSANSFKLHRLPIPRPGQVLGLVGANGSGKTTALKILGGVIKPNFGDFNQQFTDKLIINHFKGSELQKYFTKLYDNELTVSMKAQYVDYIRDNATGTVGEVLRPRMADCSIPTLLEDLELTNLMDKEIKKLSGGEIQRFCIAATITKKANVYIFDEPTSYLDVRQRIAVSKVIRSLVREDTYIIVVEHDLSILDYLSDYICCLYGTPSAYGVVTMPIGVREGINIFLDGYIPTENMRFRDTSFTFKIQQIDDLEEKSKVHSFYKYPTMMKKYEKGGFKLNVKSGGFSDSEIIVMVGQNGTGKTSFIKMMAGVEKPDSTEDDEPIPCLNISYKPQLISPKYQGTVRQLFYDRIKTAFLNPQFNTDILKPLKINDIIDNEVQKLSGGEIQRVAIILCLGKPADLYLLDEPSAYLDAEQRVIVSKIIKQFIMHSKKTAFIVEHDFIMATYLADRVIVFDGKPAIECTANQPQKLVNGINSFLQELDITFRRDPQTYRPRINKLDSVKDREQKLENKYYYVEV